MLSIAFIMAFVVAAVSMILGIFIYSEVSDGLGQTFGVPVLISNGTSGTISDSPMYACQPDNYSTNNGDPISLIDKNGDIISSVSYTPIGNGCGGISQDPTTGIFYIAIHRTPSELKTVDPTTGLGTSVGVSSKFITMAFDSSGELFSMNAGGSNWSLQHTDKTDGTTISSCQPPTTHRSILAFNWDNDKMYVLTWDNGRTILLLHVIDTTTCAISEQVTVTGHDIPDTPFSMTYNTVDGLFYVIMNDASSVFADFWTLETDGTLTNIKKEIVPTAPPDNHYRGLTSTLTVGVASPPIYEGGVPEAFTRADSIAFTILAIIPITLFFALFTILSPRIDGDVF